MFIGIFKRSIITAVSIAALSAGFAGDAPGTPITEAEQEARIRLLMAEAMREDTVVVERHPLQDSADCFFTRHGFTCKTSHLAADFESAFKGPLVTPENSFDDAINPVYLNPKFDAIQCVANEFVHYSYEISKEFSTQKFVPTDEFEIAEDKKLKIAGWDRQLHVFGKSGGDAPDLSAVLALNVKENTLIISFHGSHNTADWRTNLDSKPVPATVLGLENTILHHGFLLKYMQCKEKLYTAIRWLYQESEDPSELRILITGHSHGGGMAQVALLDILKNLAPELYGEHYDNKVGNKVWGWLLSSPPIVHGQSEGIDKVKESEAAQLIGWNNILSQEMYNDPVTWAIRWFRDYRSIGVPAYQSGYLEGIGIGFKGALDASSWKKTFACFIKASVAPMHLGAVNPGAHTGFCRDLVAQNKALRKAVKTGHEVFLSTPKGQKPAHEKAAYKVVESLGFRKVFASHFVTKTEDDGIEMTEEEISFYVEFEEDDWGVVETKEELAKKAEIPLTAEQLRLMQEAMMPEEEMEAANQAEAAPAAQTEEERAKQERMRRETAEVTGF